MKYIPALDGLRAIAVLAVVAYHAGLPVPAGFVGVDVFFVISGYLITGLLAREYRDTGRIDFVAFYARRVRRILPAMVAVVALTVALAALLLAPDDAKAAMRSAMASMAMVSNFYFQAVTGSYWAASAETMPLLHLWSLAVEEQFYFFWPLLLVLLYRFRHAAGVLAGLAVASFALAQVMPQEVAFYQMPARFWELAIGGLIALAPKRSWAGFAHAGLALLTVAVLVKLPTFPGIGALPAVVAAALIIHAAHGGFSIAPLELAPVRYIGLISYSLYLWHWPLLALMRASSFDAPSLHVNLALCAGAILLAALTYRFIETPFRHIRAPKLRIVGAGMATCATLAVFAGAVGASIRPDDLALRTARDFPVNKDVCHSSANSPVRLPPASCGVGPVVLWGDSHAYAWRPFAEMIGDVHPMTRGNCPPSAGNMHGDSCDKFDALAIQQAKRGEVVILAARWLADFQDPIAGKTRRGVLSALAQVAPEARRVIIMGPVPVMPHKAASCIAMSRIDDCSMPRAEFDRQASPIRSFLREAASHYPNVEYIEPADFFCNAKTCPLMKDGYSLYWDHTHISATAARNFGARMLRIPGSSRPVR